MFEGTITDKKIPTAVFVGGVEGQLVEWGDTPVVWEYFVDDKDNVVTTQKPTVVFHPVTGDWVSAEGPVLFRFGVGNDAYNARE